MWKINQNYVDKVKNILNELGGICSRCLLRCAGVRNSNLMREADQAADLADSGDEPVNKKAKINPCRLCIGLLEEKYMESAFDSICEALKKEEYDENHYTIAISLPVSLTLRQWFFTYFKFYSFSKLNHLCSAQLHLYQYS